MSIVSSSFRRTRLFLALCLASGATWAAPPPDAPQDSRHDTPEKLDEVVVFASPLRQSAEDLSQPVEVMFGEKLDEARASTLGETVGKLPGVQSSNFGSGVGRPIIRGLDGARVSTLSGGMSTQDVSAISQDHNVAIEPFLADQIEVLKGPATLLYGSGAIGGVVNVVDGRIAEQPLEQTLSGRAELRSETVNDGFTGMARLDVATAGGMLMLHGDGVHRDLRDYDTPDGKQPNSFIETEAGGFGASLVGDAGFLGFSLARYEDAYGNPGEPGDIAIGEGGVFLELLQDRYELKGGLNQEFGVFRGLRASVARTEYEHTEFEGEEIGTVFFNEAIEGRVELSHAAMGDWTGALGAQGYRREFEAIGEEAFVPRTRTRAAGVFVTEQTRWGAVQVDLGARVDDISSNPEGSAERSFKPFSLSAGFLWNLDDAWRVSVNLDRAERAPAEEELFANGPHVATAAFEVGDSDLTNERATQGELGVHYHGQRLEGKASVYQTRFDGFIYLADSGEFEGAEDPLPIRLWSQADAKFRGFEVEGIAHLIDSAAGRLDARVFFDQVHAKFDHGGNVPRIVPSRVGADLRWNADAWRGSIGAIRYDAQDDTAIGESPTRGYTLVDAHFSYHFDVREIGCELFVDANNLTDQVGRVHTSFLKDVVVLPGRNFGVGVRVFF